MRVEASRGELRVQLGKRFAAQEVARLSDAIAAFAPFSRITLDFADVESIEEPAVRSLARVFEALQGSRVLLRGVTLEQYRRFRNLGVGKVHFEDNPESPANLGALRSKRKLSGRSRP